MVNELRFLHRAALTAAVLVSVASTLFAGDELALKDKDHKDLGAAIHNLAEAENKDAKSLAKARTQLADLFVKLGKAAKKANDPTAATQAVLAMTNDLGKAIYYIDGRKASGVRAGEISSGMIEVEGDGPSKITYAIWLPKGYKSSGEPWPLVLFLPGMKDGKPYAAKQFLIENWIDGPTRDKALLAAIDMPADTKIWPEFKVDEGARDGGLGVVMRVFGRLTSTINVDFDRVYLAGFETGLPPALKLAGAYPHFFAGLIGQRGDAVPEAFENLRSVPTWFAGGGAGCTAFEERTKAAGFENCTIKQEGLDADAWAWAVDHRRVANPTKVNLVLGEPAPYAAYWLMTERQEHTPGTRVDAEVDRAANKLVINSKSVRRVTVLFNDVMLDLDKPVKVVCNGVEREEKIARSLDDFLSFAKKRSLCDGGRVYVATRQYDLPPPKD
jgi:hypothetical protein